MAATKANHEAYKAGVLSLATGAMFAPEQFDAFEAAATALGIDKEQRERDIATAREAQILRDRAACLEQLRAAAVKASEAVDEFDLASRRQRADLVDAKNRAIGEVQVAEEAARKAARLEKDNPRLAG